jgi:hypothetical protein
MESQIKRAREHAKKFEGVELLPEAERCRQLYEVVMARKAELEKKLSSPEGAPHTNVFEDEVIQKTFEEIRGIVKKTIRDLGKQNAADQHAAQLQRIVSILKGGKQDEQGVVKSPAEEAQDLLNERKRSAMNRILKMVERDVREDVAWIENLAESERPPLLPIPEPMSYVSAQDVLAWSQVRDEYAQEEGNPFPKKRPFHASFLGTKWKVPDKPLLFWGTGINALREGLVHAAEDAERRRSGADLAPPFPCAENPWGWRMVKDILDDE